MNSAYILDALKKLLKERGITYRELGSRIGLSEAGIKKMFQAGDASLSRILTICEGLGFGLEHLADMVTDQPIEDVEFNSEQQTFFKGNPSYLLFYLKLVYEGQTPSQIKQDFELSNQSVWKYLKKLDELKLIKLKSGGKADFNYSSLKRIKTEGRVFERIKSDLAISFINRIYESGSPNDNRVMMSLFKLTESSASNLKSDLLDLIESYQRKSEIESRNTHVRRVNKVSIVTGYANFSFIDGVTNID